MARNGCPIFDADTHIIEPVEPIEAHLSAADRAKLDALGPGVVRRAPARGGMSRYMVGKRASIDRRLGSRERVEASPALQRGLKDGGTPWDVRWQGPPFPDDRVSFDSHARVRDMDLEGVDVNMILPSGGVAAFCSVDDVPLELAMYEAYHRFLNDYCGAYPDRLKSVIQVSGRDVARSVAEVRRCGKERWPVGVFPIVPEGLPLDDPEWEPIWAVAEEHDLTVIIHTFTTSAPYPPGIWDTWNNMFLQRAASHVWNAQRNMAALIGAGVLDRYPALRITALECGHGWLPAWAARLDELAEMTRHALPPLKHKPSEYVMGPRYFQGMHIPEGELCFRHTVEALGAETLMFATDYPHSESWFPKSVDIVMKWPMAEDVKRKLFWDNAVRCFARYGSGRPSTVVVAASARPV